MALTTLIGLLLMPLVMIASLAHAQNLESPQGDQENKPLREYHLMAGVLLPNQIDGMSEQTPLWGLRVAFPKHRNTYQEVGLLAANAWGVSYYNAFLSWRMDIDVEQLTGHVYVGIDGHYYIFQNQDPTTGNFSNQTKFAPGAHVGGGISAQIAGDLWFRSDMKFNLHPGTSLFVGFSLVFKLDQGADDKNQSETGR